MKEHDLIEIPPADDEPVTGQSARTSAAKTSVSHSGSGGLRIANPTAKLAGTAIAAIVIGLAGFGVGVQYQKAKATSSSTTASTTNAPGTTSNRYGTGQGGFSRRGNINGSFGTVTAISASSISVQDRRSSSVKTYSITSSTTITNGGTTGSTSDIAVGDNVVVQAASATSTTATSIRVGGGPGMGGDTNTMGAPSDSSTPTDTAAPDNSI